MRTIYFILCILLSAQWNVNLALNNSVKNSAEKIDSLYTYFINSADSLLLYADTASFSDSDKIQLKAFSDVKSNNFELIFSELSKLFGYPPDNYSYYELISNAAIALNKEDDLLKKLKNADNPKVNFLRFLIFYKSNRLKSAKEIIDSSDIFSAHSPFFEYYLSYLYRGLGNYKTAADICNKVLSDKNISQFEKTKFLNALGSLYFLSGEIQSAENEYSKAKELSETTGNRIELAKAYINLGIINDERGEISKARNYFKRAIKIAILIKQSKLKAIAFSELATSFTFTGELIKARKYYQMSYDLFSEVKEFTRLSLLANNIGNLFVNIGNYFEAKKYYEEGLHYAVSNLRSKALNYIGLGDVYSNLSNYSEGQIYYNIADSLSSLIKEYSIKAKAVEGIGMLFFNIGNNNIALKEIDKAIKLSRTAEDEYAELQMLYEKALILSRSNLSAAENLFNAVIITSEKLGDVLLNINSKLNLADIYLNTNKPDESLALIREISPIVKEYDLTYQSVRLNIVLARIFEKKNQSIYAEKYFLNAIKSALKINDFNNLAYIYYSLASMKKELNKEAAEEYFSKAFFYTERVLNSLHKTNKIQIDYAGNKYKLISDYIVFLIERNKVEKAFLVYEKSKAFNTYKNILKYKLSDSLISAYYDALWLLQSGLAEESSKDSLNSLIAFTENKIFGDNFSVNDKNLLQRLQKKLQSNQIFISIFNNEAFTEIFIVGKEIFKAERIELTAKEVRILLSGISPYFANETPGNPIFFNRDLFAFNAERSNLFYKKIIAPINEYLTGKKELIFSVSDNLAIIPFEFLVTDYSDSAGPYRYDKSKYLIEKYAIRYALSAKILLAEKSLNDDHGLLVIGAPEFNVRKFQSLFRGAFEEEENLIRALNFSPLLYSSEEIEGISDLFDDVMLFEGKNATEDKFKNYSAHKSVIHLSTHAFLHKDRPNIVFAPSNDISANGLLEPGEIASTTLHGNLVVLSACRTALGKRVSGEGIIGLQKVFEEAGAQNIISTLWDINDRFSAKFMKLFYENLSKDNKPSAALRKTKIEFMQTISANPYYWAAFVLNGNNNYVQIKLKSFKASYYLLISALIILIVFIIAIKRSNRFFG